MAKMHLNVNEDYVKPVARMHYCIGRLHDGSRRFVWVRMGLSICTAQVSCPFFKIRYRNDGDAFMQRIIAIDEK